MLIHVYMLINLHMLINLPMHILHALICERLSIEFVLMAFV